ncbi:MAG: DPP IV N-terminal domain-containing protein [Bacteroidales bacterium]|nr:DPP IV N-terminal domain-containing protein [Bacteroidales bacterium]
MRHSFILAALAAAVVAAAPLRAGEPSARTVLKSITVGTANGAALSSSDITRRATSPDQKYFGWTEDSQLTERMIRRPPTRPVLPKSANPEVSYGKVPSRNEFGIDRGWYPSPDGSLLAVYRVDETAVNSFPLLDIGSRCGALKSIKYPLNGMPSEHVALCVCDTLGNVLNTLDINEFDDERYIAGVSWTPDSRSFLVQVIDRAQHNLKLQRYDASDGSLMATLLEEHNDAWVEPRDGVWFIKGSDFFIYRTDNRDGFRQLYLCDLQGGIRRLTTCGADVAYVANDGQYVYYTSAEVSPVENHLFRIKLSKLTAGRKPQKLEKIRFGKPERLTSGSGTHRVLLSPDCSHFIDRWSAVDMPGRTELRRSDGSLERVLYESSDPMSKYAGVTVEMGTVPSADPAYKNYYRLIKPAGFDPSRKYPVIVYVYGGPHSQMVTDSWLASFRPWELLMAQKGYVMYIQDNRGTDNRGAAFEKAINRRCGQAESADQIKGLEQLIAEGWVDTDRIGVCGWSYGGFMTITLKTSRPDIFKVAVAGGPVIDWKWYEVMYGERYMDTPDTNPDGFALTSLVDKASKVDGHLLICQGMEDGTVLPINSLSFIQACVENNKLADYYPYPRSEHNVIGLWREHLYLKFTDYFETYL